MLCLLTKALWQGTSNEYSHYLTAYVFVQKLEEFLSLYTVGKIVKCRIVANPA